MRLHLSVVVEDYRVIRAAHGRYVRVRDGREEPFVTVDAEQEMALVPVRLVRRSSWLWRVRSRGLSAVGRRLDRHRRGREG